MAIHEQEKRFRSADRSCGVIENLARCQNKTKETKLTNKKNVLHFSSWYVWPGPTKRKPSHTISLCIVIYHTYDWIESNYFQGLFKENLDIHLGVYLAHSHNKSSEYLYLCRPCSQSASKHKMSVFMRAWFLSGLRKKSNRLIKFWLFIKKKTKKCCPKFVPLSLFKPLKLMGKLCIIIMCCLCICELSQAFAQKLNRSMFIVLFVSNMV